MQFGSGSQSESQVSQYHEDLLQAVHLIPSYLAPGHPPCSDEVSALFHGIPKVVEHPEGAFAGLPAEIWSIILEKLCPMCTSLIVAPSVIARDISNAQLVCRKCYATRHIAWRALGKLVRDEAGDSAQRKATRDLQEHDMQRYVPLHTDISTSRTRYPVLPCYQHSISVCKSSTIHRRFCRREQRGNWQLPTIHSFSDEDMEILRQDISWEDILLQPQLYNLDGLGKAQLCSAMQPFQRKSAALQLFFTLREAAQHVFGLQHPCAVPAVVLLAVRHEKDSAATDICAYCSNVRDVTLAVRVVARRLGNMDCENELSAFHLRNSYTQVRIIEE